VKTYHREESFHHHKPLSTIYSVKVVEHDRFLEAGRQLILLFPLRELSIQPTTSISDEIAIRVVDWDRNPVLDHHTLAETDAELYRELRLYPPFLKVWMIVR